MPLLKLSQLRVSADNTRHILEDDLKPLAATIASIGILIPLVVKWDASEGMYEILDGQRRYLAVTKVLKWKPDAEIEVTDAGGADASNTVISLVANTAKPLHEADVWKAVRTLIDVDKMDIAGIAKLMGWKSEFVQAAERLGRVSEKIRQLFISNRLDSEGLKILADTSGDLADAAIAAVAGKKGRIGSWELRQFIVKNELTTNSVMFELADYEAAGGAIIKSLFSNDSEGDAFADQKLAKKMHAAAIDAYVKKHGDGIAGSYEFTNSPYHYKNGYQDMPLSMIKKTGINPSNVVLSILKIKGKTKHEYLVKNAAAEAAAKADKKGAKVKEQKPKKDPNNPEGYNNALKQTMRNLGSAAIGNSLSDYAGLQVILFHVLTHWQFVGAKTWHQWEVDGRIKRATIDYWTDKDDKGNVSLADDEEIWKRIKKLDDKGIVDWLAILGGVAYGVDEIYSEKVLGKGTLADAFKQLNDVDMDNVLSRMNTDQRKRAAVEFGLKASDVNGNRAVQVKTIADGWKKAKKLHPEMEPGKPK